MNALNETALVSCYADTVALLVTLLLMVLSGFLYRRKNEALRLFGYLLLTLALTCVLSFICHATAGQTAPWCHTLAIAARTLWEWCAFLIILLWCAFVDARLRGEKKQFSMTDLLYYVPFGVFTFLLLINLLTGAVFTYTEDNQFEPGLLYYIFLGLETVYFLISLVRVRIYDAQSAKIRFLRVLPMVLPVGLGVAAQFLLPFQADVLGFAIGALLFYLSMADELRYLDDESGMYNLAFMSFFFDHTAADDTRSALILQPDGDLPAAFGILRDTLHRDYDVIRMEEKKFLMFSGTDSRSELQLLSTRVEEAVEKHNAEHPQEPVQMTVRSRIRGRDEDVFAFIRSVTEDQDAGDPVRGVVSMISELDRLDEELKLAADIQLSMLESDFPAFPDRTEFDLYASMRPAKEVGGDFYDFFLIDKDHLALVIADVSGKGIPAALFMMVSKTLIKNQLMSGCDPATALSNVNIQLCEQNSAMMFVTVWLAVLEISTGKGLACNAGHENPCLRSGGGDFEALKYKHGIIVGFNKEAKFQNREFELGRGDSIFVYTDGVTEAANGKKELFGEERVIETLNQNPDGEPEALIRQMREAVDGFADGAPQFDDITMLCLKYRGAGGKKPKPDGDSAPKGSRSRKTKPAQEKPAESEEDSPSQS